MREQGGLDLGWEKIPTKNIWMGGTGCSFFGWGSGGGDGKPVLLPGWAVGWLHKGRRVGSLLYTKHSAP